MPDERIRAVSERFFIIPEEGKKRTYFQDMFAIFFLREKTDVWLRPSFCFQ